MRFVKAFVLCLLLLVSILAAGAARPEQSWTGEISDSACNKEHQGPEGEAVPPAPECVKVCLRGGSKYVFVAGGENVYKIANQDHPDLAKFAGKPIKLSGGLKGDVVTVLKIEAN